MRLNTVDLNLFVVLDVIYTERNLTRAAEVLCLTQPTVSNALSRLRKTLNDELFVRTPQGMVPTPMTENIIGRVRDALQLMDSSVLEGDRFDAASSERVFRLSMNDVTEALLLPELMGDLSIQAPGMSVESYYSPRRDLAMALSSGQLEMAIDIAAGAHTDLCHQTLFRERYVCAVREDHPDVGDSLTLEHYLELGHIHVSSRPRGLGLVDMQLNKMGRRRQIHLRLQHYLVVPQVVRNTELALTVPDHWAKRAGLKSLELPFELPELESHLLWHRSADGDQANRWLRERIVATCHRVGMR
jgi:DNA-binding transcriptional LysR family regulator